MLQVVQGITSTLTATSSPSFVATNLSVSITPSSASSKVLVFANGVIASSTSNQVGIGLFRNSTSIYQWSYYTMPPGSLDRMGQDLNFLDTPATTSAISYNVRIQASGGTSTWSADSTQSTIIAMEIGA